MINSCFNIKGKLRKSFEQIDWSDDAILSDDAPADQTGGRNIERRVPAGHVARGNLNVAHKTHLIGRPFFNWNHRAILLGEVKS